MSSTSTKKIKTAVLSALLISALLFAGCAAGADTALPAGAQTQAAAAAGETVSGGGVGDPAAAAETAGAPETLTGAGTDSGGAADGGGRPDISDPKNALPVQPKPEAGEEEAGVFPVHSGAAWDIIIASDLHYYAPSLHDDGGAFTAMAGSSDGKAVAYIQEITDAFLDEVISLRPDVLILSGDLTLNGEKESHLELASQLERVRDAGIIVLVIPGNHDINNHQAARYFGESRLPAEYTTPEEFREIYRDFGYETAISWDQESLSYLYELNEGTHLLMLDSCQYTPAARVGGALSNATMDWIENELELAWDDAVDVIVAAHHNLLEESEIYVDDCTIMHGEQLSDLLEEWDVGLFLSGHLHVQHNLRSSDGKGIQEIVTSSLSTPDCRYGFLRCWEDGSYAYRTQEVDVEAWAREMDIGDENLLNFSAYKKPFLCQGFYNQSMKALEKVSELNRSQREAMSELYAQLKYYYYQGRAYLVKDEITADPAWDLWLETDAATELSEFVQYMVEDAVKDYNCVEKMEPDR